jgi:peptidyl-prolyl cis-trans isomerase SurA
LGKLKKLKLQPASAAMAALVLGTLLLAAGCNREQTSGDVMAKVNGEKITRSDVEKYYQNSIAGSPQQPAGEQATSLRLNILKTLIEEEILMQRARKLGLLATDEEVEAKFAEFKAPFTQEEFAKRLQERNISADDFKRDIRRGLTTDKLINKEINSKISISDSDITNYYNEHKAEFNFIEPQYHLAQIVVTTTPNPQVNNLKNDKAQNDAEARKKVQMILNRLDSGEEFGTVAMNYSEQPGTSGNGGDMGFIPESSLKADKAAMEAIGRLKVGQYTPPIAAYDAPNHVAGYRIIKLLAREAAGQRDLSDPRVQASIRQQLRERREQLLKAAYFEVVRNEAKVENYLADELLKNSGAKK